MKKDGIKELIYGFWERNLSDVKPRAADTRFLESDMINDITGPRRAGKTYFMFSIVKELEKTFGRRQFIYLNCEHRSVYPLAVEDLNYIIEFIHQENLLKGKRVFILLDEVQTVRKWEVFAKSVYDEFGGKVKLLVSGSVKSLLSEDYGRLLSGRHRTVKIFPLSFREYLNFKGIEMGRLTEERKAKLKSAAEDYVRHGAFPKYVLSKDAEYAEETFRDIVERDVKARVGIRKREVADEMANLFLERVASRSTFTKIRDILKNRGHRISTDLAIRYSSIFENVFLFFFVPTYTPKYSEMIKNPKKIYVLDDGF